MNILLVNHYAGNPTLGMEFRPYYLAREWVKMGHKVMIVGGSYSHLRKQQPTAEKETIDGIEYKWIQLKPYKGNGLGRIRSMFDFVSKLWFSYPKYLGDFTPDVVIASSTYPIDIYPCRRIAKHYNVKLVYEVHDLWPLSPMELGGYSKHHPFIMVMQAAEDYCYRHADKVVSLLPKALDHMVERGMDAEKFAYVPNGFDPAEWTDTISASHTLKDLVERLKRDGKFVVMYAGGHAVSNALDTLLDAMKLLKESNIVALLVGNGQEKARLEERAKVENIDNVEFMDPVPKKEIPSTLTLADLLYIGWNRNPLYEYGISPNKLLDYMMSGRPILHSVNAANDWVKDASCGFSVEAENPKTVADTLLKASEMSADELNQMGIRGKQYCEKNFEYHKLAEDFINSL